MKTNKLFLGLALLATLFIGCNKSEDNVDENAFTLGNSVSRNFVGKIVDTNNNPLSNVSIQMSGKTTITDANGNFSLDNVSVLENFAYLTANKSGFITGSRVVFPNDDLTNMQIMLLPEVVVATIPSGQTSLVSLPDNTRVTFDGAFMTENGEQYNGNVKIVMNHLDPADPKVFEKMPGNLIAKDNNGAFQGLETYGMLVVEMKGNNNEKLQLMSGHTANIVMPIAPNQLDTATATIPLWHFNDATGLWEEQGFSRKVGSNYVGNVSHFSWWNNDCAYTPSVLKVIATNFDGSPIQNVRITVTRAAGSTGDVLIDLGVTGANGILSANTPLNETLTLRAYTVGGDLIDTQVLPGTNLRQRTVYINLPAPNRMANPNK